MTTALVSGSTSVLAEPLYSDGTVMESSDPTDGSDDGTDGTGSGTDDPEVTPGPNETNPDGVTPAPGNEGGENENPEPTVTVTPEVTPPEQGGDDGSGNPENTQPGEGAPITPAPAADEQGTTDGSPSETGEGDEESGQQPSGENPSETDTPEKPEEPADTDSGNNDPDPSGTESGKESENPDEKTDEKPEKDSDEKPEEKTDTESEKDTSDPSKTDEDKQSGDRKDSEPETEKPDDDAESDKKPEKDSDKKSDKESDKKSSKESEKKADDKDGRKKSDDTAADTDADKQETEGPLIVNVPEVPRRVFEYSVRHYEKIKTVYLKCKADSVNIREYANTSSIDTIVAKLSKGAVVRLIDDSDPGWWFIETRDKNGKIARGFAESGCFIRVSEKIKKLKEDPSKVVFMKGTNAGFGAFEKTTYGELSLGNDISETREDLISYALQFLGNPYLKDGSSLTDGANCSGFVQSVYAEFGISLPRTCKEQMDAGQKISLKDAKPGDLIFYTLGKKAKQVMICLANDGKGNIQVIHASSGAKRIIAADLDSNLRYKARTFDQLNAARSPGAGQTIDLSEWTRVGDCRISSYCYDCNTPAHSAITASGIPASEWHTVAVDSSVIPLGSRVFIEGYGLFVAEDTGVKGNWCDLYVYNSQCSIWDIARVYYM